MDKKQNDYLGLQSYQGHSKSPDHSDFSVFENEGEFYFAMHGSDGQVVLRSEGYSSAGARDNGINSVVKNRAVDGRYSIEESNGQFYVVLKAGNNQEIARSAAYSSKAAAEAFTAGSSSASGAGASQANAGGAVASGLAAGIAGFQAKTYPGKTRIVTGDEAATLLSSGGKILNETRTEKGTTRNMGERKLVKENRKDLGEKSRKVISETRNVISENRNQISENKVVTKKAGALALAALAAPAMFKLNKKSEYKAKALPTAAAFVPSPVDEPNDFKFWPLLLLFLLPLFFIWGCPPPAAVAAPTGIVVAAPIAPAPIAVAPVCDCDAHDHHVFNLPRKGSKTKKLERLGTWPEFGNSHKYDAPGFFNKLKREYANNAGHKKFLDEIFNEMGFDGFKDASASDFSEVTLKSGTVGNMGGGPIHHTEYSILVPKDKKDLEAFKITAKNGCHLHFMKTCGNHFFTRPCPADEENPS